MTSSNQLWNADTYAANARFVADLAWPVIDLLAPMPGERILDLGCGDGALTEKLAALGCRVVGVDGSAAMIAAAKKHGLDARMMNGEALSFENEFDAVFSNAALHWMKDPDAVIGGVHRALKPGGRFVGECGGLGNVEAISQALRASLKIRGVSFDALNPWYLASPDDYRTRLEKAGFRVREIALHPRPTPLPGEMTDWLTTFAGVFLAAFPEDQHEGFLREVSERLKPALHDSGVWIADYVRLRFYAQKA